MNEIIIASVGLAVSAIAGICVPICCQRDEVVNQVVIVERDVEVHNRDIKTHKITIEIDEVSE